MDTAGLKKEIRELRAKLQKKKATLFLMRLLNILGCTSTKDLSKKGSFILKKIMFQMTAETNWNIVYYCRVWYDPNIYNHADDSDEETLVQWREFKVGFGYDTNRFLITCELSKTPTEKKVDPHMAQRVYRPKSGERFQIYYNSTGELRIINRGYGVGIDIKDHEKLINRYAASRRVPEWLALSFFMYLGANDWKNRHAYIHFTAV